jgi:Concanavalin A-like lectin/glucanases superfamily
VIAVVAAACGDDGSGTAAPSSATGAGGLGVGGGGAGGSSGGTGPGGNGPGGAGAGGFGGVGPGYALRFFGNGVGDIDRVKIRIDDDTNAQPGPPHDVGATDFTIELFMRADASDNLAPAIGCGGYAWIDGNIVVDRDRFNQGRGFGLSVGGGLLNFGVIDAQQSSETICGTSNVLDGQWHHVAIARRRSDGMLWLWVDGMLDASADGPDGDLSYPDDGVPGNFCGGPCDFSDPFLVIGAEKHDAGPSYPSYSGLVDELRISTTLRYTAPFSPPTTPWSPDAETAGLYHFDEGRGRSTADAAAVPVVAELKVGGTPSGPLWSMVTPF